MKKHPRITALDEDGKIVELPWESIGHTNEPVELKDHFAPVRVTIEAMAEASMIVPQELWKNKNMSLLRWLQIVAQRVFDKLPTDQRHGYAGVMRLDFTFDHEGPVLKSVRLGK
ncbi:hypothetical protein [Rhodopseudomonas palustris]|uniref:hypothetical protein n=1 Tax=Rhodopseudomonas palustris TaxID=1076 RepID=UPI000D1A3DC6|nr:hypothetical protein [Rhodopseudomonas palustris]AVT83649.1 hypothetical protein RPYSC3_47890 [Rhodopseudomonas palustris]